MSDLPVDIEPVIAEEIEIFTRPSKEGADVIVIKRADQKTELTFTKEEWAGIMAAAKNGEIDDPEQGTIPPVEENPHPEAGEPIRFPDPVPGPPREENAFSREVKPSDLDTKPDIPLTPRTIRNLVGRQIT